MDSARLEETRAPESASLAQDFNVSFGFAGDSEIIPIGKIVNTKARDGTNFGFKIIWNTTGLYNPYNFRIVFTYKSNDTLEANFDFKTVVNVFIRHNATINYKFSAIVSQLANAPPEGWPFEKFGTIDREGNLTLTFDMIEDDRYFFTRDGHVDITLTFENLEIKDGYVTEVLIDYAPLEVYDTLKG
jgi:hypothetical protein